MDNAANMVKAGEVLAGDSEVLMTRVACFCHTLQLVVHRFEGVARVRGRKKRAGG
ncbi:unnamed protein product, partial [Laminaria digitata]